MTYLMNLNYKQKSIKSLKAQTYFRKEAMLSYDITYTFIFGNKI